ncbi:MOSC domain protein [Synechococcus sp. PCC 7335]|uniref:MOSC domain-containing protein n=1 Tax=Synechococcus sp. (strain ATCC 29403 / PCC 7335) TaxID=91464 RepID=UPI00017EDCD9|nr:MOSC N-terminal beta barrel domain-containing protein [Synechococcus sp. PCC 7335]EDX86104.1 MOSC domain protein [Synechococcus sp. PCC 7335]
MSTVGTIESIWRYPVKSMRGENLAEAFVAFAGLMGDRVYSLVTDKGNPGFPWFTARDVESLLLYTPRYRQADATLKPSNLEAAQSMAPGINPLTPTIQDFSVEVETPEGETYRLEDEAFLNHIQTLSGDPTLRVHFTQKSQYDCRPLSLFSVQLQESLSDELAIDVDKRRFRANLYVNWNEDKPPLYENELLGKRLKIGDQLEVTMLERDPRCKMITLDPDTSEANPNIIKHIANTREGYAGVYGAVLVEGMVKAGDAIKLLD